MSVASQSGDHASGLGGVWGAARGLHDSATGSISIIDKDEKVVLWSDEAGDRSLLFNVAKRGGQRKVADRLVNDLKKAIEK